MATSCRRSTRVMDSYPLALPAHTSDKWFPRRQTQPYRGPATAGYKRGYPARPGQSYLKVSGNLPR